MNKLPKTCCNFGRRESFIRFQFVGRSRRVVLDVVLLVNCPSFPIGGPFFWVIGRDGIKEIFRETPGAMGAAPALGVAAALVSLRVSPVGRVRGACLDQKGVERGKGEEHQFRNCCG